MFNNILFNIINILFFIPIKLIINDGVYNIMWNDFYLSYKNKEINTSLSFKYPNTYFRIIKSKDNDIEQFYFIEQLISKLKLSISIFENKLSFIQVDIEKNDYITWNFIKIKDNKYAIRNKNKFFIKISNFKIFCKDITIEEASQFDLRLIFKEVKENQLDNEILEKEPIDILIKFIDLRDPKLKRKDIHQIEKDYDNEELRYSLRSILKNISWVRKIFIVMPNNKVRYFKEYNKKKKKIVYVKDKELIDFDSSNSYAFQFRYWKMKKFGISDNFIIMDDDYFIGKKLKKNDFFYVQYGKVIPLITCSQFFKIDKVTAQNNYYLYKLKAKMAKEEQNLDIFKYSEHLTYLFLINIFKIPLNESIFIPKFTHNALPVNLEEIKEIYNVVYNSKYKETTLNSLYRHIETVQFQIFLSSYTFIKYKRKVKDISHKYIDIKDCVLNNYNYSLFCINKGAYNYSDLTYYTAKIVMKYLFPNPTPYEVFESPLDNISFNVVLSMKTKISRYEKN